MASVLITGASTGIGRASALRLDRAGWRVFAGVRKEADAEALQHEASDRLRPIIIDVTDQATIEAAAKTIKDETLRLEGLVNNAGVSVQGALEYLDVAEIRRQFAVNVEGQVAVTQAFLPLIRNARGRIVFMSSIAGRAPALPFIGPYSASKKALEGIGESLRTELLPWGIKVTLIEPGAVATPIWDKGDSVFDDLIDALPPEGRERYGKAMDKARNIGVATGNRGIDPDKVAVRVEHALTARHPRFRYLVGLDAKSRAYVEKFVPNIVRDRTLSKLLGY